MTELLATPNDIETAIDTSREKNLNQLAISKLIEMNDKGIIYVDKSIHINAPVKNSQINTGDKVRLQASWGPEEKERFDKFVESVKDMNDVPKEEVDDALETLNDLKEKKEQGTLRPTFLKKMWNTLPDGIKLLNGALDIYNSFEDYI